MRRLWDRIKQGFQNAVAATEARDEVSANMLLGRPYPAWRTATDKLMARLRRVRRFLDRGPTATVPADIEPQPVRLSAFGFALMLLFGGGLGFVSGLADWWGISRIAGGLASVGGALLLQGALLLLAFRLHTVTHRILRRRLWLAWGLFAALSVFFSFAGMDARWNQKQRQQTAPAMETEAVREQAVMLQQAILRNRTRALASLSQEMAALQEKVSEIDAQIRHRLAGWVARRAAARDLLQAHIAMLRARQREWEALDLDVAHVLTQPTASRRYLVLTATYRQLSRLWAVAPPGPGTPPLPLPPAPRPLGLDELRTGTNDDLAGPLLRLLHPQGIQWLWLLIAALLEAASLLLLFCGAFDPRAAERIDIRRVPGEELVVRWPELAQHQERCRARLQLARDPAEWARRDEDNRIADAQMDLALELYQRNPALRKLADVLLERNEMAATMFEAGGLSDEEQRQVRTAGRQLFMATVGADARHFRGLQAVAGMRSITHILGQIEGVAPELQKLEPELLAVYRRRIEALIHPL